MAIHNADGVNVEAVLAALRDLNEWNGKQGHLACVPAVALNLVTDGRYEQALTYLLGAADVLSNSHFLAGARQQVIQTRQRMKAAIPGRCSPDSGEKPAAPSAAPTPELLYRPVRQDGHKVFRTQWGISLCDFSGPTPDDTDDGPLIVEPFTRCTVGLYNNKLEYTVPVTCTRSKSNGVVCTSHGTFMALVQHVEGLLADNLSPQLQTLREQLRQASI